MGRTPIGISQILINNFDVNKRMFYFLLIKVCKPNKVKANSNNLNEI
jgi:hypothetical protein